VYEPVTEGWMPRVGLGLTLWHGVYEGWDTIWLRWCDRRDDVIPTGAEQSLAESARAEAEKIRADDQLRQTEAERQRADAENARAEKFLALLREKGIDPGNG
jgi:hypothetical protein